ncbi:hypothetical protein ATE84_4578 [Aquimarina sp. MAR_2010_214]|uniref:hypothetical protein n=1 Tax=Aquimarina sp. MAR_2010_214 TaxID=1250026 RepID=UPI000C7111F6|nr:hypothetical protein [Aquimarina sp. MAR_2010_214]PKV52462.1 hypothetical protein ATE84_4578 [Aquimarina sp. MAR_2010_214]
MIYRSFFGFLYSYFKKGKDIDPLISSTFAIVGLQVLNLIFFQGLLFFHYSNQRHLLYSETRVFGFGIITLLIFVNYFYFKKREGEKLEKEYRIVAKKKIYILFYWIYILASIALAIIMLYTIRNNIRFF